MKVFCFALFLNGVAGLCEADALSGCTDVLQADANDEQALELLQMQSTKNTEAFNITSAPRITSRPSTLNAGIEKLLFVTAVGDDPDVMDLVMADVSHLRANYNGQVDVFLLHYTGTDQRWLDRNFSWYKRNVQNATHKPGYKFPLLAKVLERIPLLEYNWVWAIDEDIDITQTNVSELFHLANESGSPIVGPAIASGIRSSSLQDGSCPPGSIQCMLQAGDPANCRFSYTKMIEVMAPLLRPKALWHVVHSCPGCFSNNSIWGLDLVWCSRAVTWFGLPKDQGCALIDRSPVIHKNLRSIDKTKVAKINAHQYERVAKMYPNDIVRVDNTSVNLRCVH